MFTSGIQANPPTGLTVVAIVAPVVYFLYFLALLRTNPYMSFLNYLYELFVTVISMVFPIIYRFLPFNTAYAMAFPAGIIGLAAVVILIQWRYDSRPRLDIRSDESRPTTGPACSCLPCCISQQVENADDGENDTIVVDRVDLMDIEQVLAEDPPLGKTLSLNRKRFQVLTERAIEVMSAACNEEDVKYILQWLAGVSVGGLTAAGWYLGSSYGIWQERASIRC
jgi:hypothetical protein